MFSDDLQEDEEALAEKMVGFSIEALKKVQNRFKIAEW